MMSGELSSCIHETEAYFDVIKEIDPRFVAIQGALLNDISERCLRLIHDHELSPEEEAHMIGVFEEIRDTAKERMQQLLA